MRARKYWLVAAVLAALIAPASALAAISVGEAAVGTSVQDRQLYGQNFQFDRSVGRLYAFTRIVGAENPTQVSHRWYHGDELVAEVSLPVRGNNWRTWSSKAVMPDWIGSWRVEVVSEDGSVIDSLNFTVQ